MRLKSLFLIPFFKGHLPRPPRGRKDTHTHMMRLVLQKKQQKYIKGTDGRKKWGEKMKKATKIRSIWVVWVGVSSNTYVKGVSNPPSLFFFACLLLLILLLLLLLLLIFSLSLDEKEDGKKVIK